MNAANLAPDKPIILDGIEVDAGELLQRSQVLRTLDGELRVMVAVIAGVAVEALCVLLDPRIILGSCAGTTRVWQEILDAGREFEIVPCGLGARNTLRLEASMPLYGHEITEDTNVFEAGLDRFCKLDKPEFLGQDALKKLQQDGGPQRKLVGMEMMERGIGRDGYPICTLAGEQIGNVTSGSPAPFLKKNIALGYVPPAHSAIDTELAIRIRGQNVRARIVAQPFYRRPKKRA